MSTKTGIKRPTRSTRQENLEEGNVSSANETEGASSKEVSSKVQKKRERANEEPQRTTEPPETTKEPSLTTQKIDHKPMTEQPRGTQKPNQKPNKPAPKETKQPQGTQKPNNQPIEPPPPPPPPQKTTPGEKTASFTNICNAVVILLLLALVVVFAAIVLAPPEHEIKTDFDFPKIFENKLMELQTSFTNQTDRFWRILKKRGLAHLRNKNRPQPLVLLMAAPPAAHGVADCLARKLAEALDPRNKRMLATIDGTEEKRFAGEKVKKKMDKLLTDKFRAGHRVALIHHLELLPPPSPLLFYSYCHDRNAPHKHVAFIFTVHLPAEPDASLSPREAEGTAEKYLSSEVWAREDQEAVAALLSHVADTVALMNGEPDSVKASC